MTRQEFDTIDHLRLEVEVPPESGIVNVTPNPDGALGGWGWRTPAGGSYMLGSPSGGLTYVSPTPSAYSWFTTEHIPVVPGQYVAAMWDHVPVPAGSAATTYEPRLEWVDANGTEIGAGAWGGTVTTTDPAFTAAILATQVPAGTSYVRLRFTHKSTTGGNPPAESVMMLTDVRIGVADTSAALTFPIAWVDPWVNVLGPTHSIEIDRAGLDVGTLDATILDAALDPSQSSQLRPGRRVRCTVRQPDDTWEPIYTGKADTLDVTYDEKAQPPKPPRVRLVAVDAATALATPRRSQGVGTIDELPFLLEGAGVPWDTNGSGNQVASAVAVAQNENATALDQVAIARDTRLGAAWVDRRGVLHVYDRVSAPVVPGGDFEAPLDDGGFPGSGYVFGRDPLYCDAARVTSPVRSGTGALRLTADGNAGIWNYMGARTQTGVNGIPIVGGRTYTVSMWSRAATTPRLGRILGYIYNGNTLRQSVGGGVLGTLNSTSGWTEHTLTFTAAPGAKFLSLSLIFEEALGGSDIPSGEVHYIDDVTVTLHRRNPLVIDEARYSDLDVTFATDDLVNSVNVKLLSVNYQTGETEEVTYGSYEDDESVREWGRRSGTYTVQGLVPAELDAYAAAILDRNGTPAVRPNSVVLPVKTEADLTTSALVDLYDEPSVVYAAKGIDQVLAVTRVRHRIEPEKWLVDVEFGRQDGVASAKAAPVLANMPALGVPDGVWQPWTIANTKGATFAGNYVARYTLLGDTVHCYFRGTIIATADTGPVAVNLPLPARAGYDTDTVTGTAVFHNPGQYRGSGLIGMGADNVPANHFVFWTSIGNNSWLTTANFPPGGASGDEIVTAVFTYERAT